MVVLKNILVATDFSEPSNVAVAYGRDLARNYNARLHVIHVVEDVMLRYGAEIGMALPALQEDLVKAARRDLESRLTDEDRQQLNAVAVIDTGANIAAAICDYAKNNAIDLIVTGTHGRGAVQHFLMGSVAERVVRTASCPVLTVHAHERDFIVPDALTLAAVGIAVPRSTLATSIDDAVVMAARLGFPVALKAVGPTLIHKTEHKAVRLNLENSADVRIAATQLLRLLGDKMDGLLVQRMISGGAEMMIGAIKDPTFGHVIVCGTGGTLIELIADSACRLHPLTDQDAADMVASLKGARLLHGFRGGPPVDATAYREAVLRISALVGICPEIQELDINPLAVLREGVAALDVRVRVAANAHPVKT